MQCYAELYSALTVQIIIGLYFVTGIKKKTKKKQFEVAQGTRYYYYRDKNIHVQFQFSVPNFLYQNTDQKIEIFF